MATMSAAGGTLESRFLARIAEYRRLDDLLPAKQRDLETARAAGDDAAARRLEADIQQILGGRDHEVEYLLDAMPFIKEYSSTQAVDKPAAGALSSFVEVTHKSNRNNVLQRYLMHVEKQVDATTMAAVTAHEDPKESTTAEYLCDACDAGMDYHGREAMLVCRECGRCKPYTEMSAANLTYEQEVHQDVVTYFAYKRLNHFCEWLNSLQAKVRNFLTHVQMLRVLLVVVLTLAILAAMYQVVEMTLMKVAKPAATKKQTKRPTRRPAATSRPAATRPPPPAAADDVDLVFSPPSFRTTLL